LVLGMMQALVENHGDGYGFMLERINNYIERILARDRDIFLELPMIGSLEDPVCFDDLPEDLKQLLGTTASEQVKLMGRRTAEMHKALAGGASHRELQPEDFSLHYQRSLFSSMQALVREAYQTKSSFLDQLPTETQAVINRMINKKSDILDKMKRIYKKKLDVWKIRIHGNFHLGKILFTGKDIIINDFGGDPTRAFSERRLKRSPLRDVAVMFRCLNYLAYDGFIHTGQVQTDQVEALLPFANIWAHYMSQFFLHAYLENVAGTLLVPTGKQELSMMLETYLLEKAVYDVNHELRTRPQWSYVPVAIIEKIIG